jgi:hypothetical protein
MQMRELGVRLHGVTLKLETDHLPLLTYAAAHLHGLVDATITNPDMVVKCFWLQEEGDTETNPFAGEAARGEPVDTARGELVDTVMNVIGKRMLGNADELIWLDTLRMKGLQLRFRREAGRFIFDVVYRFHPKKEKVENLPEYEYKKYFSLMSYLVYYPLIWHLERFRGWTTLHASALAFDKLTHLGASLSKGSASLSSAGILIGGLGGVGKTTTCVALMQRPGVALMSENIIFTDGEFIYPCDEPIRLDADSLAMLGGLDERLTETSASSVEPRSRRSLGRAENPPGLIRMAFPEGLKDKWLFHLKKSELPPKIKPQWMFLPQFSARRYLKALAPELAAEKIQAMNRLTRELDDYGWYAAALNMHWPKAGQARNRIEVLRRFAQQARCYELGIDRSAGVEAVVEDIFKAIQ